MKNKMKILCLGVILLYSTSAYSQRSGSEYKKEPKLAISTNLMGLVVGSLNVSTEVLLNPDYDKNGLTLNLAVSYSPFTYTNNTKFKHIAIQPELRLWLGGAFQTFFIGAHLNYANYNAGGISDLPFGLSRGLNDKRYQGNLYGAGISGGYQYRVNDRWGFQTSLGLGYAYMKHEVFNCIKCGTKIGNETKNYFGPTRVAVSIVYNIK